MPFWCPTSVNIRAFVSISYELRDDFATPRGRLRILSNFLNGHMKLGLQKHGRMEIVHTAYPKLPS